MSLPSNTSNFNSGVVGSAWWRLLGTPELVYISQWDALVRRFQARVASGFLSATFPSALRPGTNRRTENIQADGYYGQETADALAEVLKRAGMPGDAATVVTEYRAGNLTQTVPLLIWTTLFVQSVTGSSATTSAPKGAVVVPASIVKPTLNGGATRVRTNGVQAQFYVAAYDPARYPGIETSMAAVSIATPAGLGPIVPPNVPSAVPMGSADPTKAPPVGGTGLGGVAQQTGQGVVDGIQGVLGGGSGGATGGTKAPGTTVMDGGKPGTVVGTLPGSTGSMVYPGTTGGLTPGMPGYMPVTQPSGLPFGWSPWAWGGIALATVAVVGGGVYVATKASREDRDEPNARAQEDDERARIRARMVRHFNG